MAPSLVAALGVLLLAGVAAQRFERAVLSGPLVDAQCNVELVEEANTAQVREQGEGEGEKENDENDRSDESEGEGEG